MTSRSSETHHVNALVVLHRESRSQESDVLLFVTSIGFDLSCYDIFGTLAAGGRKLCLLSFRLPSELLSLNPKP